MDPGKDRGCLLNSISASQKIFSNDLNSSG